MPVIYLWEARGNQEEEIFFYSLASQSEIPADNTSVPTLKAILCFPYTPAICEEGLRKGTEQKKMESSPESRMLIGRFVQAGQGDKLPLEQEIRSSQGIRGG